MDIFLLIIGIIGFIFIFASLLFGLILDEEEIGAMLFSIGMAFLVLLVILSICFYNICDKCGNSKENCFCNKENVCSCEDKTIFIENNITCTCEKDINEILTVSSNDILVDLHYCFNCGNDLNNESYKYCPSCGINLKE